MVFVMKNKLEKRRSIQNQLLPSINIALQLKQGLPNFDILNEE